MPIHRVAVSWGFRSHRSSLPSRVIDEARSSSSMASSAFSPYPNLRPTRTVCSALSRFGGSEFDQDLNGYSLSALRDDPAYTDDVTAFDNETIRAVVVKNWVNEAVLYAIFLRLNTGTVPLSPQEELRQALHPGGFVTFAEEYSTTSLWIARALGLDAPDFRMRDVEILVRFFAFDRFLAEYNGNLKQFLDRTCAALNEQWAGSEASIRDSAARCDAAIEATFEVFGEKYAFRRWNGESFELRFNRAVFDIMVFYFKHPEIADRARQRIGDVVEAFKVLSSTNGAFAQALVSTTKSVGATNLRLDEWGLSLGAVLEMDLSAFAMRGFRPQLT